MNISEMLENWTSDPKNPKNIQMPFRFLIAVWIFLKMINPNNLSEADKEVYEWVMAEIKNKRTKIINRKNYAAVANAFTLSEKEEALENYLEMKNM